MAIAVHVYDIIVLHAGRGPTLIDSKLYILKKTSYNSSQVPKFLISNSDRTRWYLFECCCNVHDPRNLIFSTYCASPHGEIFNCSPITLYLSMVWVFVDFIIINHSEVAVR